MHVATDSYHSLSTWLRRHALLASLIVLLAALIPRVFLAWRVEPNELVQAVSDSATYLAPAYSLVEEGAFLDSVGQPEISRTPGYPAFLAMLIALLSQDLGVILLAQSVILSAQVLVVYLLARSLLPPVMALVAGGLAAFSPWSAVLAGMPLADGLYICLLALLFLALKRAAGVRQGTGVIVAGMGVGLLTGTAVLVKPVWPLILLSGLTLVLSYGIRKPHAWLLLASMLACASLPLSVWQARNLNQAAFSGLSDIPELTAWRYLASRVKATVSGQDRFVVKDAAMVQDRSWGLSRQETQGESWRQAKAVFRDHPFLTGYCFLLSATEHLVHPSASILSPAGLNFRGDSVVLGLVWAGLLFFAYMGWRCASAPDWDDGSIERGWLLSLLLICILLTLSSGVSFGQGARLRAPLELIVPLFAAIGLVRMMRAFQPISATQVEPPLLLTDTHSRPVLAVLIPVYNEVYAVENLIQRVLAAPIEMDLRLFVVNDASTDGSGAVLEKLAAQDTRIQVLHHPINRGKGAAIRTAIAAASGDFAVIQDADHEYDPNDYPQILAPLVRGDAEAVFGSRYLNGAERQVLGYWHSRGNGLLTTFFNIVHNIDLTDMETCYKAMPLTLLQSLRLTRERFGIEPEIAARLAMLRARIIEVPIRYSPRSYQEGKKIGWWDALDAFYLVLKFKYLDVIPCIDTGMVRHLAMAEAPRYQAALAESMQPFLGQRVLEVGAGIGNLATHLTSAPELLLAEPTSAYRRQLVAVISYRSNVSLVNHDVFSAAGQAWAQAVQPPDTIVAVNQLEGLADDEQGLKILSDLVAPGGRLIFLVPCHPFLYGRLDQALKRQNRYRAHEFCDLVRQAGLQIESQKWLGKLALVGWFIESKIGQRQFFEPKSLALLNLFAPLMKMLDRFLPWPGLSLFVVARRPLSQDSDATGDLAPIALAG